MDTDLSVRLAAFSWLAEKTAAMGDVLPRTVLQEGFPYENIRVSLVSPQGIHKPRILDLPLSITTTVDSPYKDGFGEDDFLHYHYRGSDPGHPDNVGLRTLMERQRPLIYFAGIATGQYWALWPVFVI